MTIRTFVAFDTETCGLSDKARVVDFAAILFCHGKPVGAFSSLINPGDVDLTTPEAIGALKVNGLSADQLAESPDLPTVAPLITGMLTMRGLDCLVAHNAEFDLRMLRQHFSAYELAVPTERVDRVPVLDTMLLDFALVPGFLKRNLGVVGQRWLGQLKPRHRAKWDALVCGRVLAAMFEGREVEGQVRALAPDIPTIVSIQERARPEWHAICAKARAKAEAKPVLDI